MPAIFLLFVAVPIVEIALLVQVGSYIGTFNTIAIVIVTAVIGTWLLRQQGMATLQRAQLKMQTGELPASQLVEGVLLLVGGVLLLTPGFVTDAFGFCCLIPYSRRFLARWLSRRSTGFVFSSMNGASGPSSARPDRAQSSARSDRRAANGNVLEGEYRRDDPD